MSQKLYTEQWMLLGAASIFLVIGIVTLFRGVKRDILIAWSVFFFCSLFYVWGEIRLNKLAGQEAFDESVRENQEVSDPIVVEDTFQLDYLYAGLGSNFGSLQPVFRVKGEHFRYTLEQNSSYTGEKQEKPQLVCEGSFRKSSLDSILQLCRTAKDSLVRKMNLNIMSGGIHSIRVKAGNFQRNFELHNAHDPVAQKIVNVLNTYIPAGERKLWIFPKDE